MKRILALLTLALVTSCATVTSMAPIKPQNIGDDAERHLISRYNDTSANCGVDTKPAFLCNGILIRGTSYKAGRHSWDNSPANHTSGGVSFSYLRTDSKFTTLAYNYNNGYIFLPYDHASGKIHPEVLCMFPIDAGSFNRADKGCGATTGVPGSQSCRTQGIFTQTQWYTHYMSVSSNRNAHQCGFNTTNALNHEATAAFNVAIWSTSLLAQASITYDNELRIAVWPDGYGTQLPLEAFFYINDSAQGKIDAQNDQRDFKNTTGIAIPVISIQLPPTITASATFKYLASDQAIALP